ncbi:MAG: response regulator [Solirubrobacterales bacterium]
MSTATDARIVVADDSGLMRRVVSNALEREGFTVVGAARNGDEALALCRRHRPAAMTLDLAMPGLDGMGVLRELQKPGASDVPVVVVSAFSPAHGARAVDAGRGRLRPRGQAGRGRAAGVVRHRARRQGAGRRRVAAPAPDRHRQRPAATPGGGARPAAPAIRRGAHRSPRAPWSSPPRPAARARWPS